MKIHIIGCSGSGKTYLANALAKKYNIPHFDLEEQFAKIHLSPLWTSVPSKGYKKDIFLNTDLNSHKVVVFKEHRTNYAPFYYTIYDFFETIPNKPLLNLEKLWELYYAI